MHTHPHSIAVVVLISVMATAGIVAVTRLPAQTGTTVVDAPPSLSLTVNTANPAVSGYRPGVRAYFSVSATDDKALEKVVIDTSPMMYSGQHMEFGEYYVKGKTFWEEKVYIIVPSNPGAQFVTATATDSAGQVVTKTVNFTAPACTTDADCGGGNIQWSGTSYCGVPDGSNSLRTAIMQYGVDAVCKAGGICDTSSLPRVKQQCAAGQVCGGYSTQSCMARPADCAQNGSITTTCVCGKTTVVPPSAQERYCCGNVAGAVSAYSEPCKTTCSIGFAGSKNIFTTNDTAQYNFSCTMAPNSLTVQILKGDGGTMVIRQSHNVSIESLSFTAASVGPGDHTLRLCLEDERCGSASIVATYPFLVHSFSPAVATGASLGTQVPRAATGATSVSIPASTNAATPSGSPSGVGGGTQQPQSVLPAGTPSSLSPSVPRTATGRVVSPVRPMPIQRTATGGQIVRPSSQGEEKRLSSAEVHRETQLLKSRGKQTSGKIKSIEKNIASLEKKIDAKLRLLDRVKKPAVQKRVSAQIDGWQKKIDGLEAQKEKLELTMDELRESYERLKATVE